MECDVILYRAMNQNGDSVSLALHMYAHIDRFASNLHLNAFINRIIQ